jgi:hypothetical protein
MLNDSQVYHKGRVVRFRYALDGGVVCFRETAPLRVQIALFVEPSP